MLFLVATVTFLLSLTQPTDLLLLHMYFKLPFSLPFLDDLLWLDFSGTEDNALCFYFRVQLLAITSTKSAFLTVFVCLLGTKHKMNARGTELL